MILCHKCAGLLAHDTADDITGLNGCGCISGYVRGFEPRVDRPTAIATQLAAVRSRAALYASQGRPGYANVDDNIAHLSQLA